MATATTQKRVLLVAGAILAVVALALGIALAGDDDGDDDASTTTTSAVTSSTGPTTSTGPTSTVAPPTAEDLDLAAFPYLQGGTRFDDPQALVTAFATQVLGFDTDVVVEELQQGDSRSGEIVVRPASETGQGPATTIPVRQISDDSWVVIAAITDTIRLDEPEARATVASPVTIEGAAAAFEGHVDVALYADGEPTPIATMFVTGRGDGVLGDFSDELEFDAPDGATHGVLVLSEPSAQDGTTWRATAVRVRF